MRSPIHISAQPLQLALRGAGAANGCTIALPGGNQIKCDKKLTIGQFIICNGDQANLADGNRRKIAELALDHAATLPTGESKIDVQFPAEGGNSKVPFDMTIWALGKGEDVGKREL